MRALLLSAQGWLFLALLFLCGVMGQSLSVATTSAVVGATVNYTFTIGGASSATHVEFTFQDWSANNLRPYQSSTLCFEFDLQISPIFIPPNSMRCDLTTGSSDLTITRTNMLNPSSTKPYPLTVTLHNSSTSTVLTQSLTATQLQDFTFIASNYDRSAAAVSSSVSFSLTNPIYMSFSTVLSLRYDSNIISLTIPSTADYTLLSNTNG